MKRICFSLIGVTFLSTLAATQVVEEIITRVNNQIITRSEFLRSKDQLKEEVKQQDAANADKVYGQREKDILRDLIDQQLLLEKGKDLGFTGDTELVKRLDRHRRRGSYRVAGDGALDRESPARARLRSPRR